MSKRSRILTASYGFLLLLAAMPAAWAQEVTQLEVRKAIDDDDPMLAVQLRIPLEDVTSIDFENPIDPDKTQLIVVTDDTGYDLLAAHEAAAAERKAQGWSFDPALRFGGVIGTEDAQSATLSISLKAAPAAGARVVDLKGAAVFRFLDTASADKTTLEGVPLEMEWNSPGVETSIGMVKVEQDMAMTMEDVRYQGYRVTSPDAPITAVSVDGDVTAKVREMGMGVGPNVFFLTGDAPATVDLEVDYASTTTREVPFEVSFGVGL